MPLYVRIRFGPVIGAEHRLYFAAKAMCRLLQVHPSGLHTQVRKPFCQHLLADQRQTKLLRTA